MVSRRGSRARYRSLTNSNSHRSVTGSSSASYSRFTGDGPATNITAPEDAPPQSQDSSHQRDERYKPHPEQDFLSVGNWADSGPLNVEHDHDPVLSPSHIRQFVEKDPHPVNDNEVHPSAGTTGAQSALRQAVRAKLVRAIHLIDSSGDGKPNWIEMHDQVNQASAQIRSACLSSFISMTPAPASNASVNPNHCFLCEPHKQKEYRDRGTLVRHFRETHKIRFRYLCTFSHCDFTATRRDRINTHMEKKHHHTAGRSEVDLLKQEYPCPRDCNTCNQVHERWESLEACYVEYCHASFSVFQAAEVPDFASQNVNNAASLPKGLSLNPHGAAIPSHALAASAALAEPASRPPALPRSLDAFDNPDRPQKPQVETGHGLFDDPQDGPFGFSPEVPPPAPPMNLERPRCRQCGHIFADCASCLFTGASTDYCHACPDSSANTIYDTQSSNSPEDSRLGGQGHPNLPFDPQARTRHFMADLMGRGQFFVGVVRDDNMTNLHELGDPKIRETSTSATFSEVIKQLEEFALSPTYSTDPPLFVKFRMGHANFSVGDDVKAELPLAKLENPTVAPRIRACLTPTVAGADLSPERRVELTVTELPQGREPGVTSGPGRSLKSHVRIVVRLFKIRSSVLKASMKSNAKAALQQAVELTLGSSGDVHSDGLGETETKSVSSSASPATTPTASTAPSTLSMPLSDSSSTPLSSLSKPTTYQVESLYDTRKQSLEAESGKDEDKAEERQVEREEEAEEELEAEWCVQLELNSSYDRLLEWLSELAGDFCPFLSPPEAVSECDLSSDSTAVLQSFTICLLYVIMILARLEYIGSGPRLGQ